MQIKKDNQKIQVTIPDVDVVVIPIAYLEPLSEDLIIWQQSCDKRKVVALVETFEETVEIDQKIKVHFLTHEIRQSLLNLLWEHVFMPLALIIPEGKSWDHSALFESLKSGVHLVASEYCDFGLAVYKNVRDNALFHPAQHSFSHLKDALKGLPAVICGAGPSLTEDIDSLASLSSKAVIASGGAALSILSSFGIGLHMAAGLDPTPDEDRFLSHCYFQTPFFYQKRFSSSILSKIHAEKISLPPSIGYFFEQWLSAELGQSDTSFEAGWTVTTLLLALLNHMGCSPIFLVGNDLGYTNKMYADSTAQTDQTEIQTKADWLQAKEWIDEFACKNPSQKIINTSARVQYCHVTYMTLKEAISQQVMQDQEIQGRLHAALEMARVKDITHQYKRVFDDLDKSLRSTVKLLDGLFELFSCYHPASPIEKAEYILLEYDLYEEVFYKVVLEPLWSVWQHVYARLGSKEEADKKLHQLLFYQTVVQNYLNISEGS